MSIEEDIAVYVELARATVEEIKTTLDAKVRALEDRDFREAYRLAGIVALLARSAEELDRTTWELLNPEEVEDEYTGD